MTCSICRKVNCTKKTHCFVCSKEKRYPVHHRTGTECKLHSEISLAKTTEEKIAILKRNKKCVKPPLPPRPGEISISRPELPPRPEEIERTLPKLPLRTKRKTYKKDKIKDKIKDKSRSTRSTKCVICLDTLSGSMRHLKKCSHSFHYKCLQEGNCDFCPLCRTLIPESERTVGTQLSMQLKIEDALKQGLRGRAKELMLQDEIEQKRIKEAISRKLKFDPKKYTILDDGEEDEQYIYDSVDTSLTEEIDKTGVLEIQKYEEELWKIISKTVIKDFKKLIKDTNTIIIDSFQRNLYSSTEDQVKENQLTQSGINKIADILKNNIKFLQSKINYSLENKIPIGLLLE